MEVDDNTFLSGSLHFFDAAMKVWNKTTGKCLFSLHSTSSVASLLRLRNNTTFLCGLTNGTIEERRIGGNFGTLYTLKQHHSIVRSMCELRNGNVVSGSEDMTVIEWDMKTKTVIRTFSGHSDYVYRVAELRNNTIATASADKTVRVWEETTGKCAQVLQQHTRPVYGLVELSDGTLLTGSTDQTIREWNNKGECVSTCQVNHQITCMRELRDGSIVTGGGGGEIEVRKTWNKK